MHKIFENNKEPLFGRATAKIHLKPFRTNVLKEILSDYFPQYNSEDLLALYAFTGGVAKYVQLFMDNGAYTKSKMLGYISEYSHQIVLPLPIHIVNRHFRLHREVSPRHRTQCPHHSRQTLDGS